MDIGEEYISVDFPRALCSVSTKRIGSGAEPRKIESSAYRFVSK